MGVARNTKPGRSGASPAPQRVGRATGHGLIGLQQAAGNQAVAALVAQRVGGWSGSTGWNAAEKSVGAIKRIPIQGLKEGEQGSWLAKGSGSEALTDEKAGGKAIALVHKDIKPDKPIDVLLHLHGYAEHSGRPYAGWRQHKNTGEVRDVANDQIAQQIESTADPQLLGLLPQGGEQSQFGGLKADPYIGEALGILQSIGALASKPPAWRTVLSAHSGGGHTVRRMLTGGKKGGKPSDLKTIALFEAINGTNEMTAVKDWFDTEVAGHLSTMTGPGDQATKKAHLAKATRLRAYYRPGRSYAKRHEWFARYIDKWFKAHGDKLGAFAADVRALYQVIPLDVGHEKQVRQGLAHALGAGGAKATVPAPGQKDPTPAPAQAPAPKKPPTPEKAVEKASTSPGPGASTDNTYLRIAGDITAKFESGGDYGKLQTYDAGVISYGKHQATLSGGNLYEVVNDYVGRSQSATAKALAAYLPRLKSKDKSLAGDKTLLDLLKTAASDGDMRAAQDSTFKREYWDKSAKRAKGVGITSALGYALMYDTQIQGGIGYRLKEVKEKLGGNIGDTVKGHVITEQEWLLAFVEARIAAGKRQAEKNKEKGEALLAKAALEKDASKAAALKAEGKRWVKNGEAMLISATKTRGPTWKALVESGNLDLKGDEKGMVKLTGKNSSVRGLSAGATIEGAGSGGASVKGEVKAPSAAPAPATAPSSASAARRAPLDARADAISSAMVEALAPGGGLVFFLASTFAGPLPTAVDIFIGAGQRDETELTDMIFSLVNPELGGGRIPKGRDDLKDEWLALRSDFVRPALVLGSKKAGKSEGKAPAAPAPAKAPPASTDKPRPAAKSEKVPDQEAQSKPVLAAQYEQLKPEVQKEFKRQGSGYGGSGFDHYVWMSKLMAKRKEVGTNPVPWLNSLEWGVPFCGSTLAGVHSQLLTRLRSVEAECQPLVTRIRTAGGPVVFEGKFQPRPVTGDKTKLSDHGLGLALHLNYSQNPYIGRNSKASDLIARIAADAGQDKFWQSFKGKYTDSKDADIERYYRLYAAASDAVAKYFRAIDVMEAQKKSGRLDAEGAAELEKRKKERKILMGSDLSGRDPKNGIFFHTADMKDDPMLELIKLLAVKAQLGWGGSYAGKAKDLHHFAAR